MFTIVKKEVLNPTVVRMEILAPLIAKKSKPGQFVIVRATETGERIPLTVADANPETGTITIIFQLVGTGTYELGVKKPNEHISDLVGPLGVPSHVEGFKKVAVVGGGVGCAIAYPIAKALHQNGTEVHSIIGFRTKDLVILQREFELVSDRLCTMSDDGSYGQKGLVTDALKNLLEVGNQYDEVIAIGPLVMMKYVCLLTKQYNMPTVVSMNPIMIDGTGMCGCCRLTVGGKTKFACVDGPDFDGHQVDFDEAMKRSSMYSEFERKSREENCNLLKEVM